MENFKELAKLYKWAAETEAADNLKLYGHYNGTILHKDKWEDSHNV